MMLTLTAVMLAAWGSLAGAQLAAPALDVAYERRGSQQDGELPFVNVTILVNGVEIRADQASIGSARREFTLRGNVAVTVSDVSSERWRGPNDMFYRGPDPRPQSKPR
jgi:hypothetical protein